MKELKETRKITENVAEKGDDKEDFIALVMGNIFSDQSKSYQRERRSAVRRIVSEVYSPPRVTDMLRKMAACELMPGMAMDLTTVDEDDGKPWDFDDKAKRDKAKEKLREQKPLFLVGSPHVYSMVHMASAERPEA